MLRLIWLRESVLDRGGAGVVESAGRVELRGGRGRVWGERVVSGEEFVASDKGAGGECGRGEGECESGAVTRGGGGARGIGGCDQDPVL